MSQSTSAEKESRNRIERSPDEFTSQGKSLPAVPVLQNTATNVKQLSNNAGKKTPAYNENIVQPKADEEETPTQLDSFAAPAGPIHTEDSARQSQPYQFETKTSPQQQNRAPQKNNQTGLPDQLKTGIENLSGHSLDDVKVHYNSTEPAQLQAFAYAQGTNIHVGPGQEKHLPHEAWHVVQQKQGRVKPTLQMKEDVAVNDDKDLEREADVMGDKALQGSAPLQAAHQHQNIVQQVTDNGGNTASQHLKVGKLYQSETSHAEGAFADKTSVVIEVNEMTVDSAKAKIDAYNAGIIKNKIPVAFVIGINQKDNKKRGQDVVVDGLAREIATYLETKDINGGCFSFIWTPTGDDGGGYTFPFLEARSLLTLHGGVGKIHTRMNKLTGADPIVRGMDGDVKSDPLLSKGVMGPDSEEALVSGIEDLAAGKVQVVSGGYVWDAGNVKNRLEALTIFDNDTTVANIQTMIGLLNKYELLVRNELTETYTARSVYWPEPNTYMTLATRKAGATAMRSDRTVFDDKSQQKESTHYVKAAALVKGNFNPDLAVIKPMKTYLDELLTVLSAGFTTKTNPGADEIKDAILTVRQTHLNPAAIDDNYNWTDKKMKYDTLEPAKAIVKKHLDKCSGDIVSMMKDLNV